MPLTLAEFLASAPDLVALRRQIDAADRHDRRLLKGHEGALVQLLSTHWKRGCIGWLTADEAAVVAAELTAEAERLHSSARAEVRGDHIVFFGGRHGEHALALGVTSQVRARRHWEGYVTSCSSTGLLQRLTARGLALAFGWARGKRGER